MDPLMNMTDPFSSQRHFPNLGRLLLATLILLSLSRCTAILDTSAVATAAKHAVSVAALPVKAAISLASSDEDEDTDEDKDASSADSDED